MSDPTALAPLHDDQLSTSTGGRDLLKAATYGALGVLSALTVNRGELVEIRPVGTPPPAIERRK